MARKPVNPHPERPELGEIINQDGKAFFGTPNPNKGSTVKYIYSNEAGQQVCSAFRSDGVNICTTTALKPNGRCNRHGGASLSGAAAPNFQHGRFSRNLPTRLLERYQEALDDPKLHDLTDDLALIDTRIGDVLQQMEEGGGEEIFKEIKESYTSFKYANQDGDKQAMREALRRLDDSIRRGSTETYLWSELRALQEQRRKIVLAHAKHLQMTNQTVTVTKVNLLISALLDAVRQNVGDPVILNRINQAFMQITSQGARQLKA